MGFFDFFKPKVNKPKGSLKTFGPNWLNEVVDESVDSAYRKMINEYMQTPITSYEKSRAIFKLNGVDEKIIATNTLHAQDGSSTSGISLLMNHDNLIVNMHGLEDGGVIYGNGAYDVSELIQRLEDTGLVPSNTKQIYTMSCYGGLQQSGITAGGVPFESAHTSKQPLIGDRTDMDANGVRKLYDLSIQENGEYEKQLKEILKKPDLTPEQKEAINFELKALGINKETAEILHNQINDAPELFERNRSMLSFRTVEGDFTDKFKKDVLDLYEKYGEHFADTNIVAPNEEIRKALWYKTSELEKERIQYDISSLQDNIRSSYTLDFAPYNTKEYQEQLKNALDKRKKDFKQALKNDKIYGENYIVPKNVLNKSNEIKLSINSSPNSVVTTFGGSGINIDDVQNVNISVDTENFITDNSNSYISTNPSPQFSEDTYRQLYKQRNEEYVKLSNNDDLLSNVDNPIILNLDDPIVNSKKAVKNGYLRIYEKNNDYLITIHGEKHGYVVFGENIYDATTLSEVFQENNIIPQDANNIYILSCYGGRIQNGSTKYNTPVSKVHTSQKVLTQRSNKNPRDQLLYYNGNITEEFAKSEIENAGKWKLFHSEYSSELEELKDKVTDKRINKWNNESQEELLAEIEQIVEDNENTESASKTISPENTSDMPEGISSEDIKVSDETTHKLPSFFGDKELGAEGDGSYEIKPIEPSETEKLLNPKPGTDIVPIDTSTAEVVAEAAEETVENAAKESTELTQRQIGESAAQAIEKSAKSGPSWLKIGLIAAGVIGGAKILSSGSNKKNKSDSIKTTGNGEVSNRMTENYRQQSQQSYLKTHYIDSSEQELARSISRYRYGRTG